jgi:hypothetical protein
MILDAESWMNIGVWWHPHRHRAGAHSPGDTVTAQGPTALDRTLEEWGLLPTGRVIDPCSRPLDADRLTQASACGRPSQLEPHRPPGCVHSIECSRASVPGVAVERGDAAGGARSAEDRAGTCGCLGSGAGARPGLSRVEVIQNVMTPLRRVLGVAEALSITIGSAARVVNEVEVSGWYRRLANPCDARSHSVEPQGEGLLSVANGLRLRFRAGAPAPRA